LVGLLSLRETAAVLAAAGVVVANDCGLGHVAAAVGVPTILLFGPTPDAVLGEFPPNVRVLRAGLRCEPCWRSVQFGACAGRIDCLAAVHIDEVADAIGNWLLSRRGECVAFDRYQLSLQTDRTAPLARPSIHSK
jgi:ADP-heptose:LPS heptosyltransferase